MKRTIVTPAARGSMHVTISADSPSDFAYTRSRHVASTHSRTEGGQHVPSDTRVYVTTGHVFKHGHIRVWLALRGTRSDRSYLKSVTRRRAAMTSGPHAYVAIGYTCTSNRLSVIMTSDSLAHVAIDYACTYGRLSAVMTSDPLAFVW